MEWLTQNWIWILLAVGVFFMMSRGGMGCGGGGHRSHSRGNGDGHGAHGRSPDDEVPHSESAVDPVSGRAIEVTHAVTSVYKGRTYYFATRENRDSFEASPERFAAAADDMNRPSEHRRRRRGC